MSLSGFSKVIFHSMGDGFAFVKLQIKRKKKKQIIERLWQFLGGSSCAAL